MNEEGPPTADHREADNRKRNLLIAAAAVPVAGLFAVLGWALAESGGTPGGLGVVSEFGAVAVEQRLAPDFHKQSLDGVEIRLSDLRGKAVLLDFWASWCPPCRDEAPALAQVYRDLQGEDVEFIGVALDENISGALGHIQEFGLQYPNVWDSGGFLAISYGVARLPVKFFIDADGRVVERWEGPIDETQLRNALEGLSPVAGGGDA